MILGLRASAAQSAIDSKNWWLSRMAATRKSLGLSWAFGVASMAAAIGGLYASAMILTFLGAHMPAWGAIASFLGASTQNIQTVSSAASDSMGIQLAFGISWVFSSLCFTLISLFFFFELPIRLWVNLSRKLSKLPTTPWPHTLFPSGSFTTLGLIGVLIWCTPLIHASYVERNKYKQPQETSKQAAFDSAKIHAQKTAQLWRQNLVAPNAAQSVIEDTYYAYFLTKEISDSVIKFNKISKTYNTPSETFIEANMPREQAQKKIVDADLETTRMMSQFLLALNSEKKEPFLRQLYFLSNQRQQAISYRNFEDFEFPPASPYIGKLLLPNDYWISKIKSHDLWTPTHQEILNQLVKVSEAEEPSWAQIMDEFKARSCENLTNLMKSDALSSYNSPVFAFEPLLHYRIKRFAEKNSIPCRKP